MTWQTLEVFSKVKELNTLPLRKSSRDKRKKEAMLSLFCCLLKEHRNISGMFRKVQEPWGFLLWALSSREGAGELVPSSLDNSSVNSLCWLLPTWGLAAIRNKNISQGEEIVGSLLTHACWCRMVMGRAKETSAVFRLWNSQPWPGKTAAC